MSSVLDQVSLESILDSARFARRVRDLAEETGLPRDEVEKQARGCLAEMVATIDPRPSDVWDAFGKWLSRSYSVDAATEYLPKLRALSAQH